MAFSPRVPLPLQRCERDHSKHDKRRPGRTLSADTVPNIAVLSSQPQLQRDCIPQLGSSSSSRYYFSWALSATASGMPAHGRSSSSAADVAENAMCGGISLSRSEVMSAALALGAGIALGPRRALAAAESTAEASMGANAESTVSLGNQGSVGEVEGAKYTVGADEVGVLFGDGPIGIKLGENPLKASGVCRVYVTEVLMGSQAIRQANLRAGFGVAAVGGKAAEKLEPKEVAELIRLSPRPMEVIFRDPELLGRRLQAEADRKAEEARRRKRKAADDAASPETAGSADTRSGTIGGSSRELRVTQVGKKPEVCGTKTKAGDLIEFRYSARLASDLSVEFDSSDRRGTGLPYAVVLGNGDVIKGLDLSLFDMCVGERRKIEIPAPLAYGRKGSKLFGIPPDDGSGSGDVVFGVELVSINFSINSSDVRDNFYTDDPCDTAAVAAGNASGLCKKV
eukprot:g5335.t1